MLSTSETTKIDEITVLLDHNLLTDQVNYNAYDIACFNDFKVCFNELAAEYGFRVQYFDNHSLLFQFIQTKQPKFIINLINYGYMRNENNSYFPALFAMLNIAFMNTNMTGITITNDKNILHRLVTSANIPSPIQIELTEQDLFTKKSIIPKDFPFPAFLKLQNGVCSCGISTANIINNLADLYYKFPTIYQEYLSHSNLHLKEWLLQEYLPGPEYNVVLIGNGDNLKVFPIMEVFFDNQNVKFQTYHLKAKMFATMQIDPIFPHKLSVYTEKEIINYAKSLFKILNCRDYCRMEFRLDQNQIPKVIDVNPLTSYGKNDSFAIAAEKYGLSYKELWRQILLSSLKRNKLGLPMI